MTQPNSTAREISGRDPAETGDTVRFERFGEWLDGERGFSFRDRIFEILEPLDRWLHERGFYPNPICRLVGRMEIAYYERNTDWENPLYVNPETHPELCLQHAANLCAHGYREGCPKGCLTSLTEGELV